jgi:hypothetical protein
VHRTALGRDEVVLAVRNLSQRGLVRFVKSGCYACHTGPMLTDGAFYAARETVDRGRAAGIAVLLASPFNDAGPYVDRDAGGGRPEPLPARSPGPGGSKPEPHSRDHLSL